MENLSKQKMQQIEDAFSWYGDFKEALHHSNDLDDALFNAHVCLDYAEQAGIDHCLPAKVKKAAAMWRKEFRAA